MKKILTILCCTFILFTQSKGQSDTISGDYIVLYSGKIIQSDVVTYKNSYFHAGDKKYKEDDVSLYRNADGSFANTKHIQNKKKGKTIFYKAESVGKINVYSYTMTSEFRDNDPNPHINNYQSKNFVYYNKGLEPLKKSNYKNLKKDLGDNPNCTKTLRQYRIIKASPIVLWPMAIVSTGVALLVAIKKPFDTRIFNWLPFALPQVFNKMAYKADRVLSQKKARKAIEIYNQ